MVFRKDPCGFFCILMTYGKSIVCLLFQSSLLLSKTIVPCRKAWNYICRGCSVRRLRSCSVDSSSNHGTYTADVRRTANEQKSPILIFQGDSLWGSLHVLLFNTVSGYISASWKNKNFKFEELGAHPFIFAGDIPLVPCPWQGCLQWPGYCPFAQAQVKTSKCLLVNVA